MLLQTVTQLNQCHQYRGGRKKPDAVSVPQPYMIDQYNKGIGRVDRAAQNIATQRIAIKTKKWWWALFVWIPGMVMQNSWILYRKNRSHE